MRYMVSSYSLSCPKTVEASCSKFAVKRAFPTICKESDVVFRGQRDEYDIFFIKSKQMEVQVMELEFAPQDAHYNDYDESWANCDHSCSCDNGGNCGGGGCGNCGCH